MQLHAYAQSSALLRTSNVSIPSRVMCTFVNESAPMALQSGTHSPAAGRASSCVQPACISRKTLESARSLLHTCWPNCACAAQFLTEPEPRCDAGCVCHRKAPCQLAPSGAAARPRCASNCRWCLTKLSEVLVCCALQEGMPQGCFAACAEGASYVLQSYAQRAVYCFVCTAFLHLLTCDQRTARCARCLAWSVRSP